jgi:hypothetical protein
VRSIVGATLAIGACVAWTGACASLSGLSQYSPGIGDASFGLDDVAPPPGDDSPALDEPAPLPDAGDDVIDPPDGSGPADVGAPPVDAKSDALPPCNSTTCNGCCVNGSCAGGNSVTTCGRNGVQCSDCTTHGGACNSGVCGTKPADSGSSYQCLSTNLSACTSCAAALYTSCCKSDHTCGCQWTGFAPCM